MFKTMRNNLLAAAAALVLGLAASLDSKACTNVIISKGASADGTVMVSYAADSHYLFGELYFHPAADWAPGSLLKVYDWDSNRYLGEIPQVAHTFRTIGNMNERQLIIGETTWGGRPELEDKNGGIDYGSLIYITLQRASTAREAIATIVALANEHGYASEGETFSIADKNEAWVMDLVGKGPEDKGIVWVARRLPDGAICAHANQARIGTFPLDDPENCLYAPDVVSVARKMGWFDGEDKDFNFARTYCPPDFGTVRGCDARAWSAFNILGEGEFTWVDDEGKSHTEPASAYLDYAMGYDLEGSMPLFIFPKKKVTPKAVADVMRDHYEGTPMDMTQDIGAGGNALPYRWRPMGFEVDGKKYINERAIATQQTGFWFVGQARSAFPDEIGGIFWFGTDDAATSYVTPIYTSTTEVPECFREGNGDLLHYSPTASFWMNNRIANACYKMYNIMAPTVRSAIDAFENDQMEVATRKADEEAMALYNAAMARPKKVQRALKRGKDPFKKVTRFLTDYTVRTAQDQFAAWTSLEELLLVKYIDGNVKDQEADGTFKHSEHSDKIPSKIAWPGYTDLWKATVARDHGKVIEER